MRLLEVVLVAGVLVLVIGWMAGIRLPRWLAAALPVVTVLHVIVEGQRLSMWPAYAVIAVALLASIRRSEPRPPRHGRWRAIARTVAGAVVLLVAATLPWLWPVMRLPEPAGPFAVGQLWLVVEDSSRAERFSRDPGAIRRFPVKIWYPAPPGTTGERATYAEPRELAAAGMPPLLFGHVDLIRTHAVVGAPVADGRFPTLVFSHGYGSNFGQNTVQMEELASQGYVVASLAHPGEASWAPFPDGAGIPMDSALMANMMEMARDTAAMRKALADMARFDSTTTPEEGVAQLRRFVRNSEEPIRSESIAEWTADTEAVVNLLAAMDHGGVSSPFHGRLDLSRLGVFGMSYGGATAAEFCRLDGRCKAALNMDGAQFGGLVDDSLSVPLFIMASSQAVAVHRPVLELARGPVYLLEVPETTHIGLTDLSLFAPVAFRLAGVTGSLDPERRERIMTAYILAFFDTYLRGRPSRLLEGPSPEFPDVPLVRRNVAAARDDAGVSRRPDQRGASSTSRTLRARASAVNGFWR